MECAAPTRGIAMNRNFIGMNSARRRVIGSFETLETRYMMSGSRIQVSEMSSYEGETIHFAATDAVSINSSTTVEWDFGDGTQTTGAASLSHKFDDNGSYRVRLRVLNNANGFEFASNGDAVAQLEAWETQMLTFGRTHGENLLAMQTDSPLDPALSATYYDAARVFYNIADYTHDSSWLAYADAALAIYRDRYVAPNSALVPGYWNFTGGLREDFERNGDTLSRDWIVELSAAMWGLDTKPLSQTVDEGLSREVAYSALSMMDAESVGAPHRARLDAFVDQMLGHIDQWFVVQSSPNWAPFMFSLTAEALIRYYTEIEADPRIPTSLALGANAIWDRAWNPTNSSFWYRLNEQTPAPDLNLLIAPVYGWLYKTTGDSSYRDRGDAIFNGGVEQAWLVGAKQFNQNYRWSFDYLKWRAEGDQANASSSEFAPPSAMWVIGDEVTIHVENAPPSAQISAESQAQAGKSVQFTGTAIDASGLDQSQGFTYLWNFGDNATSTASTPSHTYSAPGSYTVTLVVTDKDGASSQPLSHQLQIIPATTDLSPLAQLGKWEEEMITYGRIHGERLLELVNTPATDPALAATYYDAARVFYNLADYTGDSSFVTYAHAAETIYRDHYVIPNAAMVPGYWNFTEGLRMDFERNGDTTSRDWVVTMSEVMWGLDTRPLSQTEDEAFSREVAYSAMAMINAESMGAAHRPRLEQFVDQMLGHIHQWFVEQSSSNWGPFMFGLTAEALIKYYTEISPDPRIPVALELGANAIWSQAWLPSESAFWYRLDEQTPAADLNLLIAPVYGWLYRETGNTIYRERGDQIFNGGVERAWLVGAKQFNQNYRWSMKYLEWRNEGDLL
jgi:PKD repeat protein